MWFCIGELKYTSHYCVGLYHVQIWTILGGNIINDTGMIGKWKFIIQAKIIHVRLDLTISVVMNAS